MMLDQDWTEIGLVPCVYGGVGGDHRYCRSGNFCLFKFSRISDFLAFYEI